MKAHPCVVELSLNAYVFALLLVLGAQNLKFLWLKRTVERRQSACRVDVGIAVGLAEVSHLSASAASVAKRMLAAARSFGSQKQRQARRGNVQGKEGAILSGS